MKKITRLITIFLFMIIIIPNKVFASEATCTYNKHIELKVFYKYGTQLTLENNASGGLKYNGFIDEVEVNDIVDSNGNISCPTLYVSKKAYDNHKYKITYSKNSFSGAEAVNGTLNITLQDDKEKEEPDAGTHTCYYNQNTDSEYGLTWDGSKVVVNLVGSRFDNFCETQVSGNWNSTMFANGACPTQVFDQIVQRYEGYGTCKGKLIVSTETILTENDTPTDVDGSDNVYDGSNNPNYNVPTTPSTNNDYTTNIDYNNICGDPRISNIMQIIGYIIFVVKILVPLIIIVLGMVDFGKAVISSDEKNINKAASSLIRRILAGLAIFFIPTIIFAILNLTEVSNENNKQGSFVECTKCMFDPINSCGTSSGGNGGSVGAGKVNTTHSTNAAL